MRGKIKLKIWNEDKEEMCGPKTLPEFFREMIEQVANFAVRQTEVEVYDNDYELVELLYTGVEDEDGQEIYDGDILQWEQQLGTMPQKTVLGVVKQGQYGGDEYLSAPITVWMVDAGRGRPLEDLLGHPSIWDVTVVGNKFENPELLEDYEREKSI